MAANLVLSFGTIVSITTGICYLWVIPGASEHLHFMMLSFLLFCVLLLMMFFVSIFDVSHEQRQAMKAVNEPTSLGVRISWVLLVIVMVGLYVFFN